jgi:hypothetical protein
VLLEAGYLTPEDFYYMPSSAVEADALQRQLREIDRYEYLPEAIRTQMKASIERQLLRVAVAQPSKPNHERARRTPAHADTPAEAEQPEHRPRAHSAAVRDTHKHR